ncbi:unnamed protein product [Schistosoma margrebowiei]|uniref:Uncharacterized protein n=1 Tax=Schistosoma margrebowiei TaxID=48269 RepID=A0A183LG39_9TREM|nr:unnamed protein product [Schistosoma margrebowiei]
MIWLFYHTHTTTNAGEDNQRSDSLSNSRSQHIQSVLRYDTTSTNQMTLDEETLENVKTFTYLDSIIDEHGGSDTGVKVRIGKVRAPYL